MSSVFDKEGRRAAALAARGALPEEAELTLDPQDWDAFSVDAHRMLDDMLVHLATIREQPAWQPIPGAVRDTFSAPIPAEPEPLDTVYRQFVTNVMPYTSGNRHPRAWGWVRGTGTPVAMLADMLAAGINASVGSGESAPILLEEQVLTWLAAAMGMPAGTSGLLTSGGTMANLLGLAVARHARAGFDVREEELNDHPRLTVYCSRETHFWARKSVELLGLGRRSLREIAVDADYRIDLRAIEAQIDADREAGMQPIAVIANAGTVNTGAVDDLAALRCLCDMQQLWLHIDGAIGALLKLSPAHAHLVAGLESADSVALDLHKWLYMPFEAGCLLVRDRAAHHAAFATTADYMEKTERGMLAGDVSFADRGIESSRSFKALKIWMSLKTHGSAKHGALIAQNMEQAGYLQALIEQHPELEMLAPRPMNVVCFRYKPLGEPLAREPLQTLNRGIVLALQESGRFVVSSTMLAGGTFAIRIAITNHRSRWSDFAALADAVVDAGRRLLPRERAS